MIISGMKIVL